MGRLVRRGGGEQEEGEPAPEPSPSGTPSPGTSLPELPSPSPGDGEEEAGAGEDGAADDSEEDEEDREVSQECRVQEGSSELSEEELKELLRACQEAQERDEVPEFTVREGGDDGRFVAGTAESGLSADRLAMSGASFDGVVEYPTADGPRRYLKLSMDEARFSGAEQWFRHDGTITTLDLPAMTMSGDVVMHVTRMEARILGIKLTFTPDFPPPLLLPSMTVTDLEVDQPLAQAGTVDIDGLEENVEP
ncbi:hypothetical protein HDA32_004441 [Spinactinospora alkalitolerans]|uniref:Uncharacterized protein n=1 Tax=Spinactinospora alkalitolerans TaxID=687207 RepID=A0A852TZR8_9ACTN|nr:DNA primase [Spinactinospora alkalitolerans]NYE49321.1 hypothetical protein [Spinactinospora alkalitolerans]